MKNKVILVSCSLLAFIAMQPAMAKSTEDIGIKNCENTEVKVQVDKPCTDCSRTLKSGESVVFTMPKREKPVIHVTDPNGKITTHKPGLISNPLGMQWFYWDGKEITTRKGKCD
jgi:hypothetical protein